MNKTTISIIVIFLAVAFGFFFLRENNNYEALDVKEYDFIVVGSGAAGSVVAARLAELSSDVKVLVLEAGKPDSKLEISMPAAFAKLFKSVYDWNYYTEPQKFVNNQNLFWPRGKVVGGSTSMNAMIYSRPNRRDFDNWDKELGGKGWSYDDLFPYFAKIEDAPSLAKADPQNHFTGGKMSISEQSYTHDISKYIIDAFVAEGYTRSSDLTNGKAGVGMYNTFMKNGKRFSAADGYLKPALKSRPDNIQLVTNAHVTSIVFDKSNKDKPKATGVVVKSPKGKYVINARKEIILSAGSVNSPQLLMLSGIGAAAELAQHNIPVIKNLPGVGKNLQDHFFFPIAHNVTKKVSLHSEESLSNVASFLLQGKGALTSNIGEFGGFFNFKESDYTDLQMIGGPVYYFGHGLNYPGGDGISMLPCASLPKSRGSISLRSSNPFDHPKIDPNYFSDDSDLEFLVEAGKLVRKIMNKAQELHPEVIGEEAFPGKKVQTDAEWREYIKKEFMTLYHPVGTCKLGNDPENGAVVDTELKVFGVSGLRVVDASVFPNMVKGNVEYPILVVAEKAADLIKKQYIN